MTMMKAIMMYEYGGPEVLKYEEVARPVPAKGQALIKIEAVGINYADTMRRNNNYLEKTPLPYLFGGEIAGTIESLGLDTTGPAPGTRVVALVTTGGYAQYTLVSTRQVYPIPPSLSFEKAVTVPVQGVTAYDIIKRSGRIEPGETVLVHAAAGGVGIFAVQLAKLLGAGKVIATASTPAKLELARSLGADELVNYTEPEWYSKVRDLTGGKGADIILEMAGGEIFNQNFKCLAPSGRVVVFGAASNQVPSLNPLQLMYRNQTVTGYWLINTLTNSKLYAEGMQAVLEWIAAGKIRLIVEHVLPLSEASQAHALLEGRQSVGKVVLQPWA